MIEVDIVIIDSGIDIRKNNESEIIPQGINIYKQNGKHIIGNNIMDSYGHGTAVYNIIKKHSCLERIFNVKIFENDDSIDEETLVYALRYIKENVKCKIINLSMGLKICNEKKILMKACNDLIERNTVIVAAFDNDGCYSFPAAFEKVIGVSSNYKCTDAYSFEVVEGGPINILAKGGYQRVKWHNSNNTVLGGNSFACAYVTAYISNLIADKDMVLEDIMNELKKKAKYIHSEKKYIKYSDAFFEIEKAAIFPVNKEIHSLIRYSKELKFEISQLYDIKQSGRVGANCKHIVNALDSNISYIIKDINDIDFESIDTIIIGHMNEINRMMSEDMRLKIVKKAIENNVNVFCFDSLEYCKEEIYKRKSKIYYPLINMSDIPQNTFGKLYNISKPVLTVCGTSSKQGKFTLQMILKRMFEEYGYCVGTIGTEPHSLLFGMDYVYPLGYNSAIYVDGHSSIALLNSMQNDLCDKEVDIIISGSQANCIPSNVYNISSFPIKQHIFLIGMQPDGIILCVNPHDDINFIHNTIKYLEGVANCKVLALVMFPMAATSDWRAMFEVKELLEEELLNKVVEKINKILNIPVYVLGKEIDMIKLRDNIIDFF